MSLSNELGVPKAANTALLGALVALDLIPVPKDEILKALDKSFKSKQALIEKNRKVFDAAFQWIKDHA